MPSKLRIGAALACAAFLLPVAGAFGADEKMPSQVTRAEVAHIVAEVTAIDLATRELTLAGPLGGEIDLQAGPEVKNLPQVKVGDLVEITYYESMAISARKKGESNPLFVGGDSSTSCEISLPAAFSTTSSRFSTSTENTFTTACFCRVLCTAGFSPGADDEVSPPVNSGFDSPFLLAEIAIDS